MTRCHDSGHRRGQPPAALMAERPLTGIALVLPSFGAGGAERVALGGR